MEVGEKYNGNVNTYSKSENKNKKAFILVRKFIYQR